MVKVIFGNHCAVRVSRNERDRIGKFYCDILGSKIMRELDDKDDIRIGDDFYIGFLYGAGDGLGACKGVNYGAHDALSDDEFLKAIFLELKADKVEEMRQKNVTFRGRYPMYRIPTSTFRLPVGRYFASWESTGPLSV